MSNKLEVILHDSVKELETGRGEQILGQFKELLEEAAKWEKDAKAIVVTDESQVDLIKKAREARLTLKHIRTNTENTRKSLKENIVREGKAIDGIANVIKALIVPLEEHLEVQEQFAENKRKEREEALRSERQAQMNSLGEEAFQITTGVDLGVITQPQFDILYQTTLKMKTDKEEAEKKLEEERVERAKAEAEEKERQKVENDRLEKELAEEKAKAKAEQERLNKELAAQQNLIDEKNKAEKEALDQKLADEKAKSDALVAAQKAQEAQPDSQTLKDWAEVVRNPALPTLRTEEGRAIGDRVLKTLNKVANGIIAASEDL